MATHEADGYMTEKHSGKYEDQTKKEHNRVVTGPAKDAPVPPTQVNNPS